MERCYHMAEAADLNGGWWKGRRGRGLGVMFGLGGGHTWEMKGSLDGEVEGKGSTASFVLLLLIIQLKNTNYN